MARRLQAEIDKMGREIRANIELYDERWQELRRFNQAQVGVTERMRQEARREQMRGKKHAVRTATLEFLDIKHVLDFKTKLEGELEASLRRLHRQKQQLLEWLNMSELRTQYDELRDWKKQIELRYKRGRIFYCLGQSSEDSNLDDVELTEIAEEQLITIRELIDKLTKQSAVWKSEVESLADHETAERKAQLDAFLDLHNLHIRKLAAISSNISSKGYSLPNEIAVELYEGLRPYIDSNDQLNVVVAEEIYHSIPNEIFASDDNEDENEKNAERDEEEYEERTEGGGAVAIASSSISTISDVNETSIIDTDGQHRLSSPLREQSSPTQQQRSSPHPRSTTVTSPLSTHSKTSGRHRTQKSTTNANSAQCVSPSGQNGTSLKKLLPNRGHAPSRTRIAQNDDSVPMSVPGDRKLSQRTHHESPTTNSPSSPSQDTLGRKNLMDTRLPRSVLSRPGTSGGDAAEEGRSVPVGSSVVQSTASFEPQLGSTGCLRAVNMVKSASRRPAAVVTGGAVSIKRRATSTTSSCGSPAAAWTRTETTVGRDNNDFQPQPVSVPSSNRHVGSESGGRKKYSNVQLITAIDEAACDWSYDARGSTTDDATAKKTLDVHKGDHLYIIKLDKSGWSFAFLQTPSSNSDTSEILTPRRTHLKTEALSKLKGGWFPDSIRLSIVRKEQPISRGSEQLPKDALLKLLEKEKRLVFPCLEDISDFALSTAKPPQDQPQIKRKQRPAAPPTGGLSGKPRVLSRSSSSSASISSKPDHHHSSSVNYVPLLERLKLLAPPNGADSCTSVSSLSSASATADQSLSSRITFPSMKGLLADVEPRSLRIVQWPWNAGQMVLFPPDQIEAGTDDPCERNNNHHHHSLKGKMIDKLLTVRKGDRIWIDCLSDDGEWVKGTTYTHQFNNTAAAHAPRGWFPASQLVQPHELVDLWDAVERISSSNGVT